MPDATKSTATAPPMAHGRRWVALVVLCVGVLMIVLDATVVNVALPAIQSDLGFSQWEPLPGSGGPAGAAGPLSWRTDSA